MHVQIQKYLLHIISVCYLYQNSYLLNHPRKYLWPMTSSKIASFFDIWMNEGSPWLTGCVRAKSQRKPKNAKKKTMTREINELLCKLRNEYAVEVERMFHLTLWPINAFTEFLMLSTSAWLADGINEFLTDDAQMKETSANSWLPGDCQIRWGHEQTLKAYGNTFICVCKTVHVN